MTFEEPIFSGPGRVVLKDESISIKDLYKYLVKKVEYLLEQGKYSTSNFVKQNVYGVGNKRTTNNHNTYFNPNYLVGGIFGIDQRGTEKETAHINVNLIPYLKKITRVDMASALALHYISMLAVEGIVEIIIETLIELSNDSRTVRFSTDITPKENYIDLKVDITPIYNELNPMGLADHVELNVRVERPDILECGVDDSKVLNQIEGWKNFDTYRLTASCMAENNGKIKLVPVCDLRGTPEYITQQVFRAIKYALVDKI